MVSTATKQNETFSVEGVQERQEICLTAVSEKADLSHYAYPYQLSQLLDH